MSDTKKTMLFVIKERSVYNTKTKAYGLYNSCRFVSQRLNKLGFESNVVQVVDNNDIDRVVTQFKPTHCFIEAIWVVPSKIETLAALHPNVNWVIRIHSMVPFLSNEGMAFEWLNEYINLRKKGIKITLSCNNLDMFDDMKKLYKHVSYTPNIYEEETALPKETFSFKQDGVINVGCFGALRPFKNNVKQAILAMEFVDSLDKKLKFHINISEHEQASSNPILRNLRAVFKNTKHELVEHLWYDHVDFIELVKEMDFGMQISFTETFNITAADFVSCGVPIVVSSEIDFVHESCRVAPHDDKRILEAMNTAYFNIIFDGRVAYVNSKIEEENRSLLDKHNRDAIKAWIKYLDY